MISVRVLILTMSLLSIINFSAPIHAQETIYDGNFWIKADQVTKDLTIGAVFWGQQTGYDIILVDSVLEGETSGFPAECAMPLSNLIKSLQEEQDSIDTAQVVKKMDVFYSNPDNRSLGLKWGFLEAMLRIQGTPEQEIKAFIEDVQKSHSN